VARDLSSRGDAQPEAVKLIAVGRSPFEVRSRFGGLWALGASTGDQEDAKGAVEDVADYLSRHSVAATAETRLLREGSISAELLLAAEQCGAELVVAGGYAHSRFQEWVFGGLTTALLGHFPKCCLLSH
jgi:nucleotide-binding universal stress UspA family protein